jgi:hypothetical protein
MTTAYTTLLGLAQPVTGELSGTWGTTVNDYITTYLDSAVAGTQTISGTQTAVTLSVTNGSTLVSAGAGATGSSQYMVINCTGTPASLLTITAPGASKVYVVLNATAQSVKLVGAGPTAGVTLVASEKAVCSWNGTDFVKVASSAISNLTGTLPVANGGTGLTAGTSGGVLAYTATGTLASSAALTQYGVVYGGGAGVVPAATANGTTGQVLTATTSGAPSWAAPAAGGISYTPVKTTNYTAANNDGVLTNTTGGAFTVTLPTSPSVGNQIIVADSFGTWGTNNLTIDPTALIKIAGQTAGTTLICNINSVAVTLVYTGATYGWDIFAQIGANDTSVLTQTNTVTGITNKTFVAPVLGAALASTLQATTTIGVGNATPSASGAGVSFPATASLSTNANTLDDYQEGTYTGTFTGVTTTVTATITYVKTGGVVTLFIPSMSGTSNATTKTITGMPSILYPVTSNGNRRYPIEIVNNNSAQVLSMGNLTNAGVMNIYINPNNDAWTATGACSTGATSITYTVSS